MIPSVSIITPAFNAEGTIGETIRSVLEQSYEDWEMLICDDQSEDNTWDIIKAYSERDRRIRGIRTGINGGPAVARNNALELSQGRWIAFLDSDDMWLPSKLETQIAYHKRYRVPLTYTGYRRISQRGDKQGRYLAVPTILSYSDLLKNTVIATSTAIVDTSVTGPFRMKNTYYDDYSCWLDILRTYGDAHGIDEPLALYRIMEDSVSRNKFKSASHVWKLYRDLEGLDIYTAARSFAGYAINGLKKYSRF